MLAVPHHMHLIESGPDDSTAMMRQLQTPVTDMSVRAAAVSLPPMPPKVHSSGLMQDDYFSAGLNVASNMPEFACT